MIGLYRCQVDFWRCRSIFGQKTGEYVNAVPLLSLTQTALYMKIAYCAVIITIMGWGLGPAAHPVGKN